MGSLRHDRVADQPLLIVAVAATRGRAQAVAWPNLHGLDLISPFAECADNSTDSGWDWERFRPPPKCHPVSFDGK